MIETIMATIAMGAIAKFLEFELGRSINEKDFVDIEQIRKSSKTTV